VADDFDARLVVLSLDNLKLEAVDVPKLITGMTDMLRRSLGPRIEIAVEFEGGPLTIQTDANQLELSLLNIALNARDAMPEGGRLQIAVRREEVKAGSIQSLNAGEHVCIELTDTGSGMDEATLLRAYKPFFTTKELGKGVGLGLSMVYGLAAQSQGALCLASQVGAGTTVKLYFPELASRIEGVFDEESGAAEANPKRDRPEAGDRMGLEPARPSCSSPMRDHARGSNSASANTWEA
jgi:signal transduction histidine kinase